MSNRERPFSFRIAWSLRARICAHYTHINTRVCALVLHGVTQLTCVYVCTCSRAEWNGTRRARVKTGPHHRTYRVPHAGRPWGASRRAEQRSRITSSASSPAINRRRMRYGIPNRWAWRAAFPEKVSTVPTSREADDDDSLGPSTLSSPPPRTRSSGLFLLAVHSRKIRMQTGGEKERRVRGNVIRSNVKGIKMECLHGTWNIDDFIYF